MLNLKERVQGYVNDNPKGIEFDRLVKKLRKEHIDVDESELMECLDQLVKDGEIISRRRFSKYYANRVRNQYFPL